MRCKALIVLVGAMLAAVRLPAMPAKENTQPAKYDHSSEKVIKGAVADVITHYHGSIASVHLLVEADDGRYDIHIAPPYFLRWREFHFKRGDRVEVVAAKVRGEAAYLARSVKLGTRTVAVRDADGAPLWKQIGDH